MASSRWTTLAWRFMRFAVAGALLVWLASRAELGGLKLADLRWGWLALGVALVPLSLAVRSWSFGLVLNRERAILGPGRLYRLTLVGAGLALFLPTGAADLAKARWGLVAHGSAEEMVVSSVVDKLTSIVAVGLLGIAAAAAASDGTLAVLSGALAVAAAIPLFARWDSAWRALVRLLAGRREIDEERIASHARPPARLIAIVTAVSVLGWLVTYAIVFACVRAVGADVSVAAVLALAPLVTVSRLVPVSAGGLGLGEVTMASLLARAGAPEAVAAQAALVQLVALVLLPGAAGLVLLGIGARAES